MTENRFEYTYYDDGTESIYDKKEDNYYWDCQLSNIEELLNELTEENVQLKQKVDFYKYFQKDARELEKENEELKKELAIYRKVANCGNCHYHNYDWYDEGDEFEVCDKGNNVNNGICEDWEEL